MKLKKIKHICGNCRLYDGENCKVSCMVDGEVYHMPVFPDDKCHMEELGIEVKEIRWWTEDKNGKKTNENGTIKMQYPADLSLWNGFLK
jgi:hypothetical protein